MLAIRFIRVGKKNQPFFRIIVTDKKNPPKGGRFLEILGFFNPKTKQTELKADRINYWISVGAKPSDRVNNLFVSNGIIKGVKKPVHSNKKSKKRQEQENNEAKEENSANKEAGIENKAKPKQTEAKEKGVQQEEKQEKVEAEANTEVLENKNADKQDGADNASKNKDKDKPSAE